jgi:ribonuclease Z
MGITRRFAILSACLAVSSAAMAQDFKVTLLGTGTPFPIPDRFGAATLVEAGKERLLFDVGRGATIRLNQIGVPMGTLGRQCFTFLRHRA